MYDIYVKPFSEVFAGRGEYYLVAKDGKIVAHGKSYEDPAVQFSFTPILVGLPVGERGPGWHKLRGFALENAQGWAEDVV